MLATITHVHNTYSKDTIRIVVALCQIMLHALGTWSKACGTNWPWASSRAP